MIVFKCDLVYLSIIIVVIKVTVYCFHFDVWRVCIFLFEFFVVLLFWIMLRRAVSCPFYVHYMKYNVRR